MSRSRACSSCGQDSSLTRRVHCRSCGDQVHPACRDITGSCYACRYGQARANGIAGDMLQPHHAGEQPFETNRPATVAEGLPLPPLASMEHPYGASANGLRIATHALYLGWHIEAWETGGADFVTLRKKGRGYLRLVLNGTGRLIRADTQRQYLRANTTRVLEYLEGK